MDYLPLQPNLAEAVTTKEKEDHSVDNAAIEAVSTRSAQPRRYLNQTKNKTVYLFLLTVHATLWMADTKHVIIGRSQ